MAKTTTVKNVKGVRKNKKHFIIFNNGGVISSTTPKDWARANQNLFLPKYDFSNSDNTPTVEEIEKELSRKGFSEVGNHEIVIYYHYKSI